MTRLKIGLLLTAGAALTLSAPAVAQMDHSKMPGMTMPAKKPVAKKPAAKKPVTKKPVTKKPAAKKPAAKKTATPPKKQTTTSADPHAGHDMSTMSAQPAPATMPPGHDMSTMPAQSAPAPTMPPGHDMSTMPAQPAPATMPPGHDMSTMPGMATPAGPAGTDLPAGNAPPPPIPAANAADAYFGTEAMEMGRHHLQEFHGGQKLLRVLFNIAEYRITEGRDSFAWEGKGWYGGDINRLWVKTEGEGAIGRGIEEAEIQALYGRAISPYFDVQAGIRYDFKPNPSRVYAAVGIEGLAPSFFDVEGTLFLSNKGELLARAEGYYDQRITQRLILQPRAELNFAAQNSRDIGVGSGLSNGEIGLRLRYDIRREFAPYVGVQYQRAFGNTRRFLKEEGEDAASWGLLTGVRVWF